MESESPFDAVLQRAIDILREFLADDKEYLAKGQMCISVKVILCSKGISHADAERCYAGLKRLGLVTVIKNGRGYVAPTITADMKTSVAQRRIEMEMSRRHHRRIEGDEAVKVCLQDKIAKAEAHLRSLHRELAQVEAQIAFEGQSQLQPT